MSRGNRQGRGEIEGKDSRERVGTQWKWEGEGKLDRRLCAFTIFYVLKQIACLKFEVCLCDFQTLYIFSGFPHFHPISPSFPDPSDFLFPLLPTQIPLHIPSTPSVLKQGLLPSAATSHLYH